MNRYIDFVNLQPFRHTCVVYQYFLPASHVICGCNYFIFSNITQHKSPYGTPKPGTVVEWEPAKISKPTWYDVVRHSEYRSGTMAVTNLHMSGEDQILVRIASGFNFCTLKTCPDRRKIAPNSPLTVTHSPPIRDMVGPWPRTCISVRIGYLGVPSKRTVLSGWHLGNAAQSASGFFTYWLPPLFTRSKWQSKRILGFQSGFLSRHP